MNLYSRIVEYDFRQLHFHEADNKSYLRFHRPAKYGDDLTKIRYSVAYVNREKSYSAGFEEGAIFNGYRFVYPLSLNRQHIGSVEVSVSMNAVIGQFSKRFNEKAQFIILKNQVMEKVFPEERSNYSSWFLNDEYMLDNAITQKDILINRISADGAEKIKRALDLNRAEAKSFCVEIVIDSNPGLVTFIPIRNILQENAAYIFVISDNSPVEDLRLKFFLVFVTLVILFIVLVIFTLYYISSQSRLEKMATFDALTKIYSRGVIINMIESEYERYQRYKTPFSLIMIDVDHFKKINDTHGHSTGDTVLSDIAGILKNSLRKIDSAGRYGGEEFIILLPQTGMDNAANVAQNIRQKISNHVFKKAGTVTISCGVAEMSDDTGSMQELVNVADDNLYRAKEEGRNRVVT